MLFQKNDKTLALIQPRYFLIAGYFQSTLTDGQLFLLSHQCTQQVNVHHTKCIFGRISLGNECNSRRSTSTCIWPEAAVQSLQNQSTVFSTPDVQLQGWKRGFSSLLGAHLHVRFDCFLPVSATTNYVFANSCHTIMYYSVFRFVYAHFIVAIIDSCCMDLKI